jgi:Tfp pilus assembly protein PilN
MNPLVPKSGIGIEMRGGSLHAVYGKSTWKGFREVDRVEIPEFEARGPQECGRFYREFLRKHGLKVPWTVVALPRSQVLLRPVQFPKSMEQDLARALEYQLAALHPFEEGTVAWDHAIWPGGKATTRPEKATNGSRDQADVRVLVVIVRKDYIGGLAEWFREAGIPVSQFCPATTLLVGYFSEAIAARANAAEPYFLAHSSEDGVELIGCAGETGFVSRVVPRSAQEDVNLDRIAREVELARSEMRLAPADRLEVHWCGTESAPSLASSDGGAPVQIVPASEVGERVVVVAAAHAAANRSGILPLNLLPETGRSYESPLASVPTYALAGVVVLLAAALGLRGPVQDLLYSRYLEQERRELQPAIQELESLQRSNQAVMAQLGTLARIRQSGVLPLDLFDELTRTLPSDAWLQQLQYEGSAVSINGTAQSASAVLQAVSASSYLEAAQFTAALTRTPEGKEVFRIGARLRAANP